MHSAVFKIPRNWEDEPHFVTEIFRFQFLRGFFFFFDGDDYFISYQFANDTPVSLHIFLLCHLCKEMERTILAIVLTSQKNGYRFLIIIFYWILIN